MVLFEGIEVGHIDGSSSFSFLCHEYSRSALRIFLLFFSLKMKLMECFNMSPVGFLKFPGKLSSREYQKHIFDH